MKTTFLFSLLAVAVAGCSTTRPKANPVALGPYSTPQKNVTITSRDRGAYVALRPNGSVTVALESNRSAGYHWKLARPLDPAVLTVSRPTDRALPPIALPPEGLTRPQAEPWVFKAVGPGTAKVSLIYARPDQPLNEAVSFDFTVNAE